MPDRLAIMFEEQFKLQTKLGTFDKARTSPVMRQMFIDKMLLAVHEEASEIARESISKHINMPFGWKRDVSFNEDKYKKEIIDLWHFTMNLWMIVGGTDQEFFEMYLDKNHINHERQENEY